MGNPTIRTQDNRADFRLRQLAHRMMDVPIVLERWRPSLLWRVMHRLGVR